MIRVYRTTCPGSFTFCSNGKTIEAHRSLVGYKSKIYNFLIFKVIINYYIAALQVCDVFAGYNKYKQSLEIRPFWKYKH